MAEWAATESANARFREPSAVRPGCPISALLQTVRPVLALSVAYVGQEREIVSYLIRTTSSRDTQYVVRYETRGIPNGAFDAFFHGLKWSLFLPVCFGFSRSGPDSARIDWSAEGELTPR